MGVWKGNISIKVGLHFGKGVESFLWRDRDFKRGILLHPFMYRKAGRSVIKIHSSPSA